MRTKIAMRTLALITALLPALVSAQTPSVKGYYRLPVNPGLTAPLGPCGTFVGGLAYACLGRNGSGFQTSIPVNTNNFLVGSASNFTVSGASVAAAATGTWAIDREPTGQWTSTAAINSTGSYRATSVGAAWRGNGLYQGGFYFNFRAGWSLATGQQFVAMLGAVDPSLTAVPSTTITNAYYFGFDPGQTTLYACSCGTPAPACACTDTTIPITAPNLFDMTVICPGEGAFCNWRIGDVVTGAITTGNFSTDPARNPATTDFLAPKVYCATGAVATACITRISTWTMVRPY